MHKEESVKVSIIIPVYNVEMWLDECLESISRQTFSDFEVILIDDGSTDSSNAKCVNWCKKDTRFTVISKVNEGPSIARNVGIKLAKGKYLAFVDADDWVADTFLEKMVKVAEEENAELVECDVYRVNDETKEKTIRVCSGSMGVDYLLKEHMKYGYTTIWKCIFKRDLFVRYNIEFPNCHSEAKALYALLLALSNKVVNVHEPLYYYRRFRVGSLSAKPRKNNGDENAIGLNAFTELMDGFKKNDIYTENEKLLEEIVKYKLSDMLAGGFYRKEKNEYFQLVRVYRKYIEYNFPNAMNFAYITLGGYNLNRVLWSMNLLHDSYGRFNFSSLISIMNPLKEEMDIVHKNRYRKIMLTRDVYSEFWNVIDEIGPSYIFLDFLEERFDVISYKNAYITKSEAYDGANMDGVQGTVLKRDSSECEEIWKRSCKAFIEKIKSEYSNIKIVLIKNYLCEKVGDINCQYYYLELDYIQRSNKILETYYDYFIMNCPDAIVVEAAGDELYFTDKDYEYGAVPSHLNDIENRRIAKKIETVLVE